MILVDTSIWIDHLRSGDDHLFDLLHDSVVITHPFIIGEIACGVLKQRDQVLRDLSKLQRSVMAKDDEVLLLIDQHQLMGRGISYIDAHLLAACCLSGRAKIWTRDKALDTLASELGVAYWPTVH